MRVLLDENVPSPLTNTLKALLRTSHDLIHVIDLDGWSGTRDVSLYDRAATEAFQAVLTNDIRQIQRSNEVEAIARSGLHRVEYRHRHPGLIGMGVAVATVCAGLPPVLQELETAGGQRLVTLRAVDPSRDSRYVVRDPSSDPPKHWPN